MERSFGRRVEESERVAGLKKELKEREDELVDKRKVFKRSNEKCHVKVISLFCSWPSSTSSG